MRAGRAGLKAFEYLRDVVYEVHRFAIPSVEFVEGQVHAYAKCILFDQALVFEDEDEMLLNAHPPSWVAEKFGHPFLRPLRISMVRFDLEHSPEDTTINLTTIRGAIVRGTCTVNLLFESSCDSRYLTTGKRFDDLRLPPRFRWLE